MSHIKSQLLKQNLRVPILFKSHANVYILNISDIKNLKAILLIQKN